MPIGFASTTEFHAMKLWTRNTSINGIESITTQQHREKMNYFTDLEEVDDDDVKLSIFSKILVVEVRKQYRGLTTGSIANLQ